MSAKARWFWVTFLAWLVVDQATKIWVYLNVEYRVGEIEIIPGFFSIVHAQNPGAAFSMLRDFEYRHVVFLGFTVVAVGFIVDMYKKLPSSDRYQATALGLILSGAVGNAIDRIHKRTVTDFLRFHVENPDWKARLIDWVGTNEYPSFNIADSTLLVGVLMFVFYSMFGDGAEAAEEPPAV